VSAFKRVHATNRAEALRTASLLCTDRRWRRITGRLIAEIEDTNILDDGGLDSLAEDFLMMDAYRGASRRAGSDRRSSALQEDIAASRRSTSSSL
jgi:hypothetical protein